ncbi:MAG: helix-turn-helix domain-containing protein [Thermoflexaceae bacterium]|nr:helix-turn-helix domain-containing protein [Thermoflexaceae bacterium]
MNYEETALLEEYPSILTPNECMEILGIGRGLLYQLIHSGELPAKRMGKKLWRISKNDLLTYLRNT